MEIETDELKNLQVKKSGCGCLSSLIAFALGVALLQIILRMFR